MTNEERLQYIDVGLRILNIQIHPDLLKEVVKVIDVVNIKKGKTNIKHILDTKKTK